VRPHVSPWCSPLPSRTSVVAVLRYSQVRQSPAPALPPAPPPESACPPRGPPHGPATRCDRAKLRRILRRTWTRPFDFPSETAFVRFLSPPLYSRRQGHPWPLPAVFLRGLVPRASFGNWHKFRRTRCNLNGGSGFCRFMQFRAAGCGRLRSRISRRNGCAFRVAL